MSVFTIIPATTSKVPILISSPHSGTAFPADLRSQFIPEKMADPDDTDWFIPRLYDFAPAMGITMMTANYNRWVIDLNRDPESKPLYTDGRVITSLVPETDFNSNPLYQSVTPGKAEIANRIERYYLPYHQQLALQLAALKAEFGYAILFDAHSIRKVVPGIQPGAFPDLILGDNNETSASKKLINIVYNTLGEGDYTLTHNHPFKGGFITRSIGKPDENIHALQLEMVKANYKNDAETNYDTERANKMRILLQKVFTNMISTLP